MEVRLALSYDDLNMKGIATRSVTERSASAIFRVCVSFSTRHGPAIRKSSPPPISIFPTLKGFTATGINRGLFYTAVLGIQKRGIRRESPQSAERSGYHRT